MFQELESLLDCDFLPDYWSDEGMTRAIEIVEEFSDLDWVTLNRVIEQKSETWQIKCAQTLGEGEPSIALQTLLLMLSTESIRIKVAVADAINALCQENGNQILLGKDVSKIKDLEINLDSLDKVDALVVSSLLSKL